MTKSKTLKARIRERQAETGESYTAARMFVLGERMEVVTPTLTAPTRHEAVVLKVNQSSARVRIVGEEGQITFRSGDVNGIEPVVPGHIVTLVMEKERWAWRGDDYASGRIESPRIDIAKLGLEPLPLEGGDLEDVRAYAEPYTEEDDGAYAKLWKKNTSKPRPSYEFHEIAWGQLPGIDDAEDNPTCMAADFMEMGRSQEARDLLMDALGTDLRVLDAHAHLGNMIFDRSPERALVHYEMGMRIGELSLPKGDIFIIWGRIYNRPFLRCLHGYGLCLWRAGDFAGAKTVFERILSFNPTDNQGARSCWDDVRRRRKWEPSQDEEEQEQKRARQSRRESLASSSALLAGPPK